MKTTPPPAPRSPSHRLLARLRDESGQAFILPAVMLVFLLGIAALVVDVGAWYHSQREAQRVADAAALAAAQELPVSTAAATAQALDYAQRNGQTLSASDVTFTTTNMPNDTVSVKVKRTESSVFAKLVGVDTVTIRTAATAEAFLMGEAQYAAPFAIVNTQPQLAGPGCPCFHVPTTLDLEKVGPGGFKILNIDGSRGGNQGQNSIYDWIMHGWGGTMDTGWYFSMPGAKFNASDVDAALAARVNTDLLFPIYDRIDNGGANLEYHVIGWAVFHVTDYDFHGNHGSLGGWFEHVTWAGVGATGGNGMNTGPIVVGLVS